MTKMSAVAPPGGCTLEVCSWATMVSDTASAHISQNASPRPQSRQDLYTATPTSPPSVLPSSAFFGCEKGAPGMLYTRTDIAPKDPTSRTMPVTGRRGMAYICRRPNVAMPRNAPSQLNPVCDHGGCGIGGPFLPLHLPKYPPRKPGAGSCFACASVTAASSRAGACGSGFASGAGSRFRGCVLTGYDLPSDRLFISMLRNTKITAPSSAGQIT
mmetsp:Transcript_32885/g.93899  ORF Transcript_32885/g.93899 Transcript_32885/m.93899 type:complete len:214 (-) Transcript_32885:868-1509(-)